MMVIIAIGKNGLNAQFSHANVMTTSGFRGGWYSTWQIRCVFNSKTMLCVVLILGQGRNFTRNFLQQCSGRIIPDSAECCTDVMVWDD
jgi:hypothetical protein